MTAASQCSRRCRQAWTNMLERFIPPMACARQMRTRLTAVWAAFGAALHGGWGGGWLWRGCWGGRASRSPLACDRIPSSPRSTRPCRAAPQATAGGHACCHLREACGGPRTGRPSQPRHWAGGARTVCCHGCRCFAPGLRTLRRLLVGTLRCPVGGLKPEARPAWPRRGPRLRGRQRAGRHPREMAQRLLQNRRSLRQGCVGGRPCHRQRRAEAIKGGRRLLRGEAKPQGLRQGWPWPGGPAARGTPARAGGDSLCRRLLRGGPVESPQAGQQRVAWSLGPAGQGFPLVIGSALQTPRRAPARVFWGEPTSSFIAEQL